ncbi:hypothetical protein LDENG_00036430 [Lucifuga dentata]|nr:hypothetical protein LDENG_00036430 [Lucifuga dentata]
MFCETNLELDMLSSVATLLIDVIFYSGGPKEPGALNGLQPHPFLLLSDRGLHLSGHERADNSKNRGRVRGGDRAAAETAAGRRAAPSAGPEPERHPTAIGGCW